MRYHQTMNVLDLTEACKTSEKVSGEAELGTGEKLYLRLYDIPSTGYIWQLEAISDNLLFLEEGEYVSDAAGTETVGGGGVQTFVILAQDGGPGRLALKRARPWDPEQISCSCTIKVTINDRHSAPGC